MVFDGHIGPVIGQDLFDGSQDVRVQQVVQEPGADDVVDGPPSDVQELEVDAHSTLADTVSSSVVSVYWSAFRTPYNTAIRRTVGRHQYITSPDVSTYFRLPGAQAERVRVTHRRWPHRTWPLFWVIAVEWPVVRQRSFAFVP